MGYMYTVLWYKHDMNRIMLILEGIKYNKQVVFISIFMKFATVCPLQTRPTVQSLAADYKNPLHLDVVVRYLRWMGDKTRLRRVWKRFIPYESQVSIYHKQCGVDSLSRSPIRIVFQPKVIAIPACRRLSHRLIQLRKLDVSLWRHKGRLFVMQNDVCHPPGLQRHQQKGI